MSTSIRLTPICEVARSELTNVSIVADEHGREWAMKQLLPGHIDSEHLERFRSEARTLARLSHPGIVPVVGASLDGERPFYLMPVASGSLEDEIQSAPAGLGPQRLIDVAASLISALRYAHEQKVLHRNLVPQKILRFGSTLRIADFGMSEPGTGNDDKLAWFRPPELRQGPKHYDERSDLYAIGKVLLYCLTRAMPAEVPPSLDRRWQYLIEHCLEQEKDQRWPGAAVLDQQFRLIFDRYEPLLMDSELRWLAALVQREGDPTGEEVAELSERATAACADDVLCRQFLASLTLRIVRAWAKHDAPSLRAFLLHADGILSPAEDLGFCDLIADQYLMIFRETRDHTVRDAIRARLFRLGPAHNRRHVGQVFASLLTHVRGPDEVAHIISLARTDRPAAAWNAPFCGSYDIDKRIRDAIVGVRTAGWT